MVMLWLMLFMYRLFRFSKMLQFVCWVRVVRNVFLEMVLLVLISVWQLMYVVMFLISSGCLRMFCVCMMLVQMIFSDLWEQGSGSRLLMICVLLWLKYRCLEMVVGVMVLVSVVMVCMCLMFSLFVLLSFMLMLCRFIGWCVWVVSSVVWVGLLYRQFLLCIFIQGKWVFLCSRVGKCGVCRFVLVQVGRVVCMVVIWCCVLFGWGLYYVVYLGVGVGWYVFL